MFAACCGCCCKQHVPAGGLLADKQTTSWHMFSSHAAPAVEDPLLIGPRRTAGMMYRNGDAGVGREICEECEVRLYTT
jgi:hypothetical protein